jgi:hypothetical protein
MAYTAKLTYDVYESNSSLFLEVLRTVLETEFAKQRLTPALAAYLPKTVKTDEYLMSPIADKEIDPSFCSIIKEKWENTEYRYPGQQNDLNHYVIGILANGLTDLRKIADAIYIILNDMDVKSYLFLYKNALGENLISDSGQYYIKTLSTEYEIEKTMNDKNVVYGHLVLQAEIAEVTKFNTYPDIDSVDVTLQVGDNQIELKQLTSY